VVGALIEGDSPGSTLSCILVRVPAVYLAHAIRTIVAILAVRGMNNLRVCNLPVGSNPTRASKIPNRLVRL
jgi:hypothetical protein